MINPRWPQGYRRTLYHPSFFFREGQLALWMGEVVHKDYTLPYGPLFGSPSQSLWIASRWQ